jgi:3-hydroxy-3-methylglutaryl CoA synthase
LLNTLDWLRANPESAKLGVVVICDTAVMDPNDVGMQGAGGVALLVGNPRNYKAMSAFSNTSPPIVISKKHVTLMRNTEDFLKPRYSNQCSPFMRGRESMDHYLEALEYCAETSKSRFNACLRNHDYVVLHGGLCKLKPSITEMIRNFKLIQNISFCDDIAMYLRT